LDHAPADARLKNGLGQDVEVVREFLRRDAFWSVHLLFPRSGVDAESTGPPVSREQIDGLVTDPVRTCRRPRDCLSCKGRVKPPAVAVTGRGGRRVLARKRGTTGGLGNALDGPVHPGRGHAVAGTCPVARGHGTGATGAVLYPDRLLHRRRRLPGVRAAARWH